MGEKELRAKYGGKLAKAINRAIRAEIPGGNAALDELTRLSGPAMHSGWTEPNGDPTPEAKVYFAHKEKVVDRMEATVRRNWQIPPATRDEPRAKRRRAGQPRGSRPMASKPGARRASFGPPRAGSSRAGSSRAASSHGATSRPETSRAPKPRVGKPSGQVNPKR